MSRKHLSLVTYRRSLPPRPTEPYWQKDSAGRFIGYWKGRNPEGESWRARWVEPHSKKKYFKSLGRVLDLTYDEALALAREWWEQCDGGTPKAGTVEEACREYVRSHCAYKESNAEYDVGGKFRMTIYGTPFGNTPLDRLRAPQVEEWKKGLVVPGYREKNSANRILSCFKAAMNFAYRRGMAPSDKPWRVVQKFPAEDRRRERILSREERRALIEHSAPDVADYLTALYYTAARPAEIADAVVGDLDLSSKTLRLATRKGTGAKRVREFPLDLNPQAIEFFRQLTRDKLPKAPLISWSDGGNFRKQHWVRGVAAAAVAAGLQNKHTPKEQRVVAYTMRHTAISEWLTEGIDIGTVAKLAGTLVGMIDSHYHKYIPSKLTNRLAHLSAT